LVGTFQENHQPRSCNSRSYTYQLCIGNECSMVHLCWPIAFTQKKIRVYAVRKCHVNAEHAWTRHFHHFWASEHAWMPNI
jgi:hypothetical protein